MFVSGRRPVRVGKAGHEADGGEVGGGGGGVGLRMRLRVGRVGRRGASEDFFIISVDLASPCIYSHPHAYTVSTK